jgi:hypothetical protein
MMSIVPFLDLHQQPNGPAKKFALLKLFCEDLKAAGFTDPRNMSCAEIEQCVGDGFRECYAADPAAFAYELLEDAEDVDSARGTFMRFVGAFDPENGHQATALFTAVATTRSSTKPATSSLVF